MLVVPSPRRSALLHRVLRGGEVSMTPRDGAEYVRGQLAQQVLDRVVQSLRRHTSTGEMLIITCRTSIGMMSGAPPGPGAADALAAIS
jgi:hypothetical protein